MFAQLAFLRRPAAASRRAPRPGAAHSPRRQAPCGFSRRQNRSTIDPYGRVTVLDGLGTTIRTASLYGNPWTFTGRRLDGETGLMQFRFRYYDVGLGRFVSRDPIGYEGGGMGLYGAYFVPGGLDPSGLLEQPPQPTPPDRQAAEQAGVKGVVQPPGENRWKDRGMYFLYDLTLLPDKEYRQHVTTVVIFYSKPPRKELFRVETEFRDILRLGPKALGGVDEHAINVLETLREIKPTEPVCGFYAKWDGVFYEMAEKTPGKENERFKRGRSIQFGRMGQPWSEWGPDKVPEGTDMDKKGKPVMKILHAMAGVIDPDTGKLTFLEGHEPKPTPYTVLPAK
jgi:RHS repeat-associated protein